MGQWEVVLKEIKKRAEKFEYLCMYLIFETRDF